MQQAQDQNAKGDPPAILTFDKDDDDTLDFVAASANLRSIVFGIEPKSKFDIKRMSWIYCDITTANVRRRNGWKYHPSDSDHQRNGGRFMRFTSFQSDT